MSRTADSNLRNLQTGSQMSLDDLIRNLQHRVGTEDGIEDINALQYLHAIANTSMLLGITPEVTKVLSDNSTDKNLFIECLPNQRIVIFDILLSINAAAIISCIDTNDVDILSKMYGPNAGQGYSLSSFKGKFLPRNASFFIQSDTAVDYSIDCSYAIIEDVVI